MARGKAHVHADSGGERMCAGVRGPVSVAAGLLRALPPQNGHKFWKGQEPSICSSSPRGLHEQPIAEKWLHTYLHMYAQTHICDQNSWLTGRLMRIESESRVHARPLACWVHTELRSHKASCWIHKDLIVSKEKAQALMTAARALGGKDRYD